MWDDGLAQVLILTADQRVESRSPQTQVRDLWWSPDGRPFAAVADAVIALADGSREAAHRRGHAAARPRRGRHRPLDERYVVDRDRKTLYVFDRKGESKTLQPAAGDVVDLAVGGHGELLVLDRKKNDVQRLGGLAAEPPKGFAGSWRRAQALAVDSGRLDLRPRQQREHDRHPRRQRRQRADRSVRSSPAASSSRARKTSASTAPAAST